MTTVTPFADIPIGTPRGKVRIPPVAILETFDPTPIGEVQLLTTWCETVDQPQYLAVDLKPNDWILTALTPLDTPDTVVNIHDLTINRDGYDYGFPTNTIHPGLNVYQVMTVTNAPVLLPAGRGQLFIAIYRGLSSNESPRHEFVGFTWDVSFYQLAARLNENISYFNTAQIALVVYSQMDPSLSTFSFNPPPPPQIHAHTLSNTGNPAIPTDRPVVFELHGEPNSGYHPQSLVQSQGQWDDKFTTDGWGSGEYHRYFFGTRNVGLLPSDPGNPAPAGVAHVPIGL